MTPARELSRQSGEAVRGIPAGRQLDHQGQGRHRARPGDFTPHHRVARRPPLGRFQPGQRLGLHVRDSLRRRASEAVMSKRILLVEDEEDNMQILRDLLATDYELSRPKTARWRRRRWQRAAGPHPDGHSTSGHGRLRGDPPHQGRPALRSIPIIAITSYALGEDEGGRGRQGVMTSCQAIQSGLLLAKVRQYLS